MIFNCLPHMRGFRRLRSEVDYCGFSGLYISRRFRGFRRLRSEVDYCWLSGLCISRRFRGFRRLPPEVDYCRFSGYWIYCLRHIFCVICAICGKYTQRYGKKGPEKRTLRCSGHILYRKRLLTFPFRIVAVEYFVHQAVFFRFGGAHPVVAVAVFLDLFIGLTRVMRQDIVQ